MADSNTWQVAASADDSMCSSTTNYPTNAVVYICRSFYKGAIRWQINIPAGATITKAFFSFKQSVTQTIVQTFRIQPFDEDSCSAFSAVFWNRAVMGNSVDFAITNNLVANTWYGGEGQTYETDIKTLVQAFIDRGGYSPNNYIGLRFWYQSGTDSTSTRAKSFDSGSTNAAKLEVTWEEEAAPPAGNLHMMGVNF